MANSKDHLPTQTLIKGEPLIMPTAYLVTINYPDHSTQYISNYSIDRIEYQIIKIMDQQLDVLRRDCTVDQLVLKARHLASNQGFSAFIFNRQTDQWVISVLIKQLPVNPSTND